MKRNWQWALVASVAFLSGWLIFANVYYIHNYYGMPAIWALFLVFAIGLTNLFQRFELGAILAIVLALVGILAPSRVGPASDAEFR